METKCLSRIECYSLSILNWSVFEILKLGHEGNIFYSDLNFSNIPLRELESQFTLSYGIKYKGIKISAYPVDCSLKKISEYQHVKDISSRSMIEGKILFENIGINGYYIWMPVAFTFKSSPLESLGFYEYNYLNDDQSAQNFKNFFKRLFYGSLSESDSPTQFINEKLFI